jgi:hypothetical protein
MIPSSVPLLPSCDGLAIKQDAHDLINKVMHLGLAMLLSAAPAPAQRALYDNTPNALPSVAGRKDRQGLSPDPGWDDHLPGKPCLPPPCNDAANGPARAFS